MADGMKGVRKLRAIENMGYSLARMASGGKTGVLKDLADQIEREHAEELRDKDEEVRSLEQEIARLRKNREALVAEVERNQKCAARFHRERDEAVRNKLRTEKLAAKRDLTDEAREAVERLRMVSHDDILRSVNPEHEIVDELCKAVGVVRQPTYTGTFDAISDRLIELIEHGGKRDADVAALRELADEVQDAIMAELDKRLMPPGMAWPRWDDGRQVSHYDTLEDATAICLALDGSCYSLHYDMPDGERVCLFDGSERVKRPEPEVLGADGEPIKAGETVWDSTSPNDPTSSTVWRHGGPLKVLRRNDVRAGFVICENDQGIPLDCYAAELTHAAPDTRERIDEDKRKAYDAYWGCDTNITCSDCPAVIDGMKPYEYYGVLNCRVAQGMDIARRKRELYAKTMGGE